MVGFCGVSDRGKLKLLKFLIITFCGASGHSLVYHILLLLIWLLSLRACISVLSCFSFIGYNFLYTLCTGHLTPESIMTVKGFVVKLFVKYVLLTFMALNNLNLMYNYCMTIFAFCMHTFCMHLCCCIS